MTDTEKLNALADDIAAGFEREPWRDQPGMGYVEIQMDKDDAAEYRAMAARIAQLEAERDALAAQRGYREGIAAAVRYLRQHGEKIETGEITVLEAARALEVMAEEVDHG
jgi:hypothetical protein